MLVFLVQQEAVLDIINKSEYTAVACAIIKYVPKFNARRYARWVVFTMMGLNTNIYRLVGLLDVRIVRLCVTPRIR